jgi:hypothetical protein
LPVSDFCYGWSDFNFSRSRQKTAEDIPLEFILDKTKYEYGRLKIFGTIKSRSNNSPYKFVAVTFSVYGSMSHLLTRKETWASPDVINPGEISFVEAIIECKNSEISRIEYNVTGREM